MYSLLQLIAGKEENPYLLLSNKANINLKLKPIYLISDLIYIAI